MNSQRKTTTITFPGLLLLLFIGLKLAKVIDWSWWWVMSPLWITAILYMAILISFIGATIILGILRK